MNFYIKIYFIFNSFNFIAESATGPDTIQTTGGTRTTSFKTWLVTSVPTKLPASTGFKAKATTGVKVTLTPGKSLSPFARHCTAARHWRTALHTTRAARTGRAGCAVIARKVTPYRCSVRTNVSPDQNVITLQCCGLCIWQAQSQLVCLYCTVQMFGTSLSTLCWRESAKKSISTPTKRIVTSPRLTMKAINVNLWSTMKYIHQRQQTKPKVTSQDWLRPLSSFTKPHPSSAWKHPPRLPTTCPVWSVSWRHSSTSKLTSRKARWRYVPLTGRPALSQLKPSDRVSREWVCWCSSA